MLSWTHSQNRKYNGSGDAPLKEQKFLLHCIRFHRAIQISFFEFSVWKEVNCVTQIVSRMSRNSDHYGSATSYPVHTFPALMVDVLVNLWGKPALRRPRGPRCGGLNDLFGELALCMLRTPSLMLLRRNAKTSARAFSRPCAVQSDLVSVCYQRILLPQN